MLENDECFDKIFYIEFSLSFLGFCNLRGVHRRLGHVQSRLPLPLHLKVTL